MGNNDTQCYLKSQKPIQHKNPRTHIPCAFTPHYQTILSTLFFLAKEEVAGSIPVSRFYINCVQINLAGVYQALRGFFHGWYGACMC